MRLTHRRPLALCAAVALALAAPAVAAAHGSGHGNDDHHGKVLRAVQRIVVIYEENHSFDNLYGGWEGVNGLRTPPRAHQAGRPGRRAVHVPAAERRQPRRRRRSRRRAPTRPPPRLPERVPQPAVPDRRARTHPDDGQDVPGAGRLRAQRRARPHRPARRLHARPRAPLLPGAVPAQRRQAESLRDRQRRRRPDPWATTTRARCPSTSTCTPRDHPDYAIADGFFQAAFGGSFLNHQWLVAAATPTWPNADNTGGAERPALGGRRQRNADQQLHRCYHPARSALTAVNGPPAPDGLLQSPPAPRPTPAGATCGDYAVNTIQPTYQPFSPGTGSPASSRRRRSRRSATA